MKNNVKNLNFIRLEDENQLILNNYDIQHTELLPKSYF